MLPHGPDNDAFQKGSFTELKPIKLENTMAFMFETRFPQQLTEFAASVPSRQPDYPSCWNTLQRNFDPSRRNWSGRA
jgi:homogentisate 1,2-dioxygenase